jgi:hypothetical protein
MTTINQNLLERLIRIEATQIVAIKLQSKILAKQFEINADNVEDDAIRQINEKIIELSIDHNLSAEQ